MGEKVLACGEREVIYFCCMIMQLHCNEGPERCKECAKSIPGYVELKRIFNKKYNGKQYFKKPKDGNNI